MGRIAERSEADPHHRPRCRLGNQQRGREREGHEVVVSGRNAVERREVPGYGLVERRRRWQLRQVRDLGDRRAAYPWKVAAVTALPAGSGPNWLLGSATISSYMFQYP